METHRATQEVGVTQACAAVRRIQLPEQRHPGPSPQSYRLDDMRGGWFVGAFAPTALACPDAEVAFKRLSAGQEEGTHIHRQATEVNLVVSGELEMLGRVWSAGDIVVVPPGCPAGSRAVSDCVLVVVKTPSVVGDKFPSG